MLGFDLTEDAASVTFVEGPNPSTHGQAALMVTQLNSPVGVGFLLEQGSLDFVTIDNSQKPSSACPGVAQNLMTPFSVRIREAAGTTYWDVYDGMKWNTPCSHLDVFDMSKSSVVMQAGTYMMETMPPGTAAFDNYNLGPK